MTDVKVTLGTRPDRYCSDCYRQIQNSFESAQNAGPENARLANDRHANGLIGVPFSRHTVRSTARTALPVTRWKAQFDPIYMYIETCLVHNCDM